MEGYYESLKKWSEYYIRNTELDVLVAKIYNESNLKKKYVRIVREESNLIKSICDGDTNFIRVFSVYYYLVWNGYFSFDKSFVFDSCKYNFSVEKGLGVIVGSGVCLNLSAHFRDILKCLNCDYDAYLVGVRLNDTDLINISHPNINKVSNISGSSNGSKILMNHADVLIAYNSGFYLLDVTNFLVYKLSRDNGEKVRNRIELRINIDSYINSNEDKRNSILRKIDLFNEELAGMKLTTVSIDSLNIFLNYGVDSCHKYMEDILMFRKKYNWLYNSIVCDIPLVNKQLEEVKLRVLNKN